MDEKSEGKLVDLEDRDESLRDSWAKGRNSREKSRSIGSGKGRRGGEGEEGDERKGAGRVWVQWSKSNAS